MSRAFFVGGDGLMLAVEGAWYILALLTRS